MTQTGTGELPALRTARRASLIEQVIEQLRGQIVRGSWAIGDRIPTEAELAQLTGTSRNTVREAVQSLVHTGLLERRQGSGTYVLANSELAGAVSRRVACAHAVHVLEVRRALEVGAAQLAALRRTDEDVVSLRRILARRNEAVSQSRLQEAATLDVALHRAIVEASHHPVLIDLHVNVLASVQENVMTNILAMGGLPELSIALVDAIAHRDPERAAAGTACFPTNSWNTPSTPKHAPSTT
jgi:DNA-binding FadR family transcriptional regulator